MKHLLLSAVVMAAAYSLLAQTAKPPAAMEFVRISPGEFMMGCSDGDTACEADEKPSHRVQITKAFEIGKYEVTQAEYQSIMGTNPSTIKGDRRPVETVARTDAEDFLNRLNARNDGYRYRLPTEAEWEYAARAGAKGPYTGKLDDIAWHADNSGDETHPVGQKKPNAWGLYDMQGNVREWVSDWYSVNYYGNSPVADPTGPATAQGPGGGGPLPGRGGFPPGRGGFPPGPGGPGPRGGRGGFQPPIGGPGGPPPPPFPPPPTPPPCDGDGSRPEDLKRQIDCLRQQVANLTQQLQFFAQRGGPPFGPGGPQQGGLGVMRGGAWDNFENFVRVSSRYNYYGLAVKIVPPKSPAM